MNSKVNARKTEETTLQPLEFPQTLKRIKTEIILGSPGMNCQGVGICKVMAYGEIFTCKCPAATAWISLTDQNKCRFSFWKSTLDARSIKRHFGYMLFQVYEMYELPTELTSTLSPESLHIYPGIYPVWETPRFLIVDF